jgi:hypothetical protein
MTHNFSNHVTRKGVPTNINLFYFTNEMFSELGILSHEFMTFLSCHGVPTHTLTFYLTQERILRN